MPHKGYQQNNFTAYPRPPCAQEDSQQQYVPYMVPNNVYTTQGQNMYDVMYGHQSIHRNQSSSYTQNSPNIYAEHVEGNWVNDSSRIVSDVERALKLSDKMETVEITSKDLSPASFCSNLDLLLPDFYKNKEPHYNKLQESQWFYNANYNLKYNEYPSCAQFNCDDSSMNRPVKYCSIQKQNSFDKSASASISTCIYNNGSSKFFNQENQCDYIMYNQNDKVQDINLVNGTNIQHDEFYPQNQLLCTDALHFPPFQNITQQNEGSNDESDIIVEESEEEVTDYSEDLERRLDYTAYCVVCNMLYISSGNQFYTLTKNSPLTMSSQQPVYIKLTEIVGKISSKCSYLCSHCLGLINTIDHLQYKLDSCRCELYNKFNLTNGSDHISESKKSTSCKMSGKQKPKNACKHIFNCKLCKKIFSLRKYYIFHMSQHKYKTRYLCEICGKQFNRRLKFTVHLKNHMRTVKIVEKKIKIDAYLCRTCKKPFRTKSNLKEHENYCSGKIPYVCKYSVCAKKFPASTKLKYHIKLKHDKKFGSICSICNIGFVKMSDYKAHMVSHSTNKKFHCSKCDKSYKTLSNLNFHMKLHNDKMPFVCDICSKGFMRKEYLESHVNKHNGIKSFACQFCDKKFVCQKNLDAHLKYHDGSVKKKNCNICGKLISTSLEDHIRTHNNLREFNCSVCDMKFNTRSALAKHKKRIHNSEVVND